MSGNLKCSAPYQWAAFAGINGVTHYISLKDIIGLKVPDEVTGGVTLRLSNGQFVSLDRSECLDNIFSLLGGGCCDDMFGLDKPKN